MPVRIVVDGVEKIVGRGAPQPERSRKKKAVSASADTNEAGAQPAETAEEASK